MIKAQKTDCFGGLHNGLPNLVHLPAAVVPALVSVARTSNPSRRDSSALFGTKALLLCGAMTSACGPSASVPDDGGFQSNDAVMRIDTGVRRTNCTPTRVVQINTADAGCSVSTFTIRNDDLLDVAGNIYGVRFVPPLSPAPAYATYSIEFTPYANADCAPVSVPDPVNRRVYDLPPSYVIIGTSLVPPRREVIILPIEINSDSARLLAVSPTCFPPASDPCMITNLNVEVGRGQTQSVQGRFSVYAAGVWSAPGPDPYPRLHLILSYPGRVGSAVLNIVGRHDSSGIFTVDTSGNYWLVLGRWDGRSLEGPYSLRLRVCEGHIGVVTSP